MLLVARTPFVFEAELELSDGTDPRAPGGAVTVALCGHWDHEGACRWPHHNALAEPDAVGTSRLCTVAVAPDDERADVVRRAEAELRHDRRWTVREVRIREPRGDEVELARRLATL